VAASTERQLARLRARFEQHARELAECGFLLKGSVLQTSNRCGSAGCGCQSDPAKRHGPYWQWTRKVKGKTVTRAVDPDEVDRYREWLENGKRFEEIVAKLFEISVQADELLREQQRQASTDRPARRRARG
jgi:hypothetical protein